MPKLSNQHLGSAQWVQEALEHFESINAPTRIDSTGVAIKSDSSFSGTNHLAVFRRFEIDTYNGPKQEDFIALAESYFAATKEELNKKKTNQPNIDLLKKRLEEYKKNVKQRFPEQYEAPDDPIALSKKIENEEKFLQQLVTDFSAILLYSESNSIDLEKLPKKAKSLRKLVQKKLVKTGRPNAFHNYVVPISTNPNKEIERMSSVAAVGKRTVPSTIRTGEYEDAPISNFVRRNFGLVSRDTKGKPTVKTEFSGLTHSSYPPVNLFLRKDERNLPKKINSFLNKLASRTVGIPLETEFTIRKIAIKGVEQVLQELTQKAISEGKTGDPIIIDLTTLSLVTPIIGKMLNG